MKQSSVIVNSDVMKDLLLFQMAVRICCRTRSSSILAAGHSGLFILKLTCCPNHFNSQQYLEIRASKEAWFPAKVDKLTSHCQILNSIWLITADKVLLWFHEIAALNSGLFVPLNCLWFGNFIVEGLKLLAWLQLWTRNHDSLNNWVFGRSPGWHYFSM